MSATSVEAEQKTSFIPLFGGILLFLVLVAIPAPEFLPEPAWRMVAVIALMLVWWVSEAVPLPVTGLLPIVLMPMLGINGLRGTAAAYAAPVVFLLLGGMTVARAMELTGLPRRITFFLLKRTGTGESGILLGFMLSAAGLSMWMSNTGTTAAMLPIALSVVAFLANPSGEEGAVKPEPARQRQFATLLLVGVAYAANIGGTATLIGTAPNILFAGFAHEHGLPQIGFITWMLVGVPFAAMMLLASWYILMRFFMPSEGEPVAGVGEFIDRHYAALGRMTLPEKRAGMVLGGTVFMWLASSSKIITIEGLTSSNIAILGAIACFLVPRGTSDGRRLLEWGDMQGFPWGVLVMFGGGLALASGMVSSGLATIIGNSIADYSPFPDVMIWVLLIAVVLFLTEVVSNTAIMAAMLPVLFSIALRFDVDPVIFALPMALAVSCAFMLPTATPPNAIVFSSGRVPIREMIRIGLFLNLVAIVVAALVGMTIVPLVFGG